MNKKEIELYKECIKKAEDTILKKTDDYDSGDVQLSDYWLYGYKSIIHELNKKLLRLRSLESKGFNSECESVEDTCIDIINYVTFLYIEMKKNAKD